MKSIRELVTQVYAETLDGTDDEKSNLVDPRKYLGQGIEAQVEVVRERIQFLGSSGKA